MTTNRDFMSSETTIRRGRSAREGTVDTVIARTQIAVRDLGVNLLAMRIEAQLRLGQVLAHKGADRLDSVTRLDALSVPHPEAPRPPSTPPAAYAFPHCGHGVEDPAPHVSLGRRPAVVIVDNNMDGGFLCGRGPTVDGDVGHAIARGGILLPLHPT
jgi:hypothetical protein